MRRPFFALWPDGDAAQELATRCLPYLADLEARAVAAADLHLTLCFLGRLDEAREALIVEHASRVAAAPFRLDLESLEYWSASQVLVLTASRIPDAALDLVAQLHALARDSAVAAEAAPWRAHVTLARRVSRSPPQRLEAPSAAAEALSLRLAAQHFFLAQSESRVPRYRRVQRWPLQRPAS